MNEPVFYISPSKQPSNIYAYGKTNEQAQMTIVAQLCVSLLNQYKCKPVLATLTKNPLTGLSSGRPAEAHYYGASLYLDLHSNATSPARAGQAAGASAYYHTGYAGLDDLAAALVYNLNAASGVPSTRKQSLFDGMTALDGKPYAVIKYSHAYGIAGILLETNYHDNPVTAKWIVEHPHEVAAAIVGALVSCYRLQRKESQTPAVVNVVYAVQAGAFAVARNAAARVASLAKAGHSAYYYKRDRRYIVQAGAFTTQAAADAHVAQLKAEGFECFTFAKIT